MDTVMMGAMIMVMMGAMVMVMGAKAVSSCRYLASDWSRE